MYDPIDNGPLEEKELYALKSISSPFRVQLLDPNREFRVYNLYHNSCNLDENFYVDKEDYIHCKVFSDQILIDEYEFSYKLNKMGFRSNHFDTLNPNNTNILYSGCSITFGEGLPDEFTWTTMLTNKINNIRNNVVAYNLGFLGHSVYSIIRNLFAFINEYGKPEFIFICFPNISRTLKYDKNLDKYLNVFNSSPEDYKNVSKTIIEHSKTYDHSNGWVLASDMIRFFEIYCKSIGVKLFWTTWHVLEIKTFEQLDYDNLVTYNLEYPLWAVKHNQSKREFPENKNNYPYWKIARDNSHPGTCWTTFQSNLFFEAVRPHL